MQYYIILFAVIFSVSGLPTGYEFVDVGNEPVVIGSDAISINGTLAGMGRNTGLAGFGAGTRGGQGGAIWTVWDAWALRDGVAGNDPRIIYVRGRIDLTALFTGSPGVALRVGHFKTITAGDNNALITGGGLRVSGGQHVVIQNLKIHNALNYAPSETPNGNGGIVSQVPGPFSTIDSIGIDRSEFVWVDHCELADDPWNSANIPDNRRRHDGLLDITQGANFITVSNTIFRNHNMVGLVGNDDNNAAMDAPRLRVTYYLNWFQGVTQRNPRVRYGRVHILNNLYTGIRSYAIGVGAGASIYVERNAFINTRRSWGFPAGTPNPMGRLDQLNNSFTSSSFDSGIPSNIGWVPSQHYAYNPMAVANVEAHVRRYAGTW